MLLMQLKRGTSFTNNRRKQPHNVFYAKSYFPRIVRCIDNEESFKPMIMELETKSKKFQSSDPKDDIILIASIPHPPPAAVRFHFNYIVNKL